MHFESADEVARWCAQMRFHPGTRHDSAWLRQRMQKLSEILRRTANGYNFSHTPPDYVAHDLAQYHPALEHELPEVLLPSIGIWQKEIQHVT